MASMAQSYTGSAGGSWTASQSNLYGGCSYSDSGIDCSIALVFELANQIFPTVSYETFGKTFLPIIQAAAQASDTNEDLGPWSRETRRAVLHLVKVLEDKEDEIEKMMTIPAQFDVARRLKSSIRIIKRELN